MKNNKESLYLQKRAYLRELSQRVAKGSPHLADFLISSHDPDIERVFDAFALLIANIRINWRMVFPKSVVKVTVKFRLH
ncbi:type VI secretion system baseplate subunit TssF [Xenorhabdus taiwanensis]|uniref:Uncharacterized protein n=1 Tax=Xenorhabdus taiwanensis TaxID=3085177 RepID=A0ABM8JUD2_9GAMM|nr:hypothetical protein TCT1_03600 [Xenorhabdus sp. TCT-1]